MTTPQEAPEPNAPKEAHQAWKKRMQEIYYANVKPVAPEYRELYVKVETDEKGEVGE